MFSKLIIALAKLIGSAIYSQRRRGKTHFVCAMACACNCAALIKRPENARHCNAPINSDIFKYNVLEFAKPFGFDGFPEEKCFSVSFKTSACQQTTRFSTEKKPSLHGTSIS